MPVKRDPYAGSFKDKYMQKLEKGWTSKKVPIKQLKPNVGDHTDDGAVDIMSDRDRTLTPTRGRKVNLRAFNKNHLNSQVNLGSNANNTVIYQSSR